VNIRHYNSTIHILNDIMMALICEELNYLSYLEEDLLSQF